MAKSSEDGYLEVAAAIVAHVLELVQEKTPEATAILERMSLSVVEIDNAFAVLERITDERLTKALSSEGDYWVVLAQGKGDRRYELNAGAQDKQGAIDLAYSVSTHYRGSECHARILNLKDSILLELDEGDLISAKNDRGQPIKVNSTRYK